MSEAFNPRTYDWQKKDVFWVLEILRQYTDLPEEYRHPEVHNIVAILTIEVRRLHDVLEAKEEDKKEYFFKHPN